MQFRRWLSVSLIAMVAVCLVPATASAYRVKPGDTLSGIAARHDQTVHRLLGLNPKVHNRNKISVGQFLRLHGKVHHRAHPRKHPRKHPHLRKCSRRFWPVPGRTVLTYPGHNGVDINRGSGWDDYGDPIRAASCGRITYVGWNRGYGDGIFMQTHAGEVVYGHTSKTYVHAGQRVKPGRLIGRVGSTGNSTAPHLHFGFVVNGSYSRSMRFLLAGGAGGLDGAPTRADLGKAAAVDQGIGLDAAGFLGRPHTHAPWSLHWNRVAQCESSGRWHVNTGNGFFGGLQFHQPTWIDFHGRHFAPRADLASRRAQKIVAERVLHSVQGIGAWPVCGPLGLL